MPEHFPSKVYGLCPLGHNPKPSTDTGSNLSTTLIDANEGQQLFWSDFHQKYVCRFHLRRVEDAKIDPLAHERHVERERKMSGMGIVRG